MRLQKQEETDCTFVPIINSRSKKLTKDRCGGVDTRLFEDASEKENKLKKLKKQASLGLFHPQISNKSRELAKGIKDNELTRLDNGKTQNVDFWRVEPPNVSNLTLKSDFRALSKHLSNKSITRKSKKEMRDKDQKSPSKEPVKSPSQSRIDPIPNYLSPYNKQLMTSDVPLKTIIDRTNKVN